MKNDQELLGNKATADSYDGFTEDMIWHIQQFLKKEKDQETPP